MECIKVSLITIVLGPFPICFILNTKLSCKNTKMYCIVNFLLDTVLKLDWDESVRCIHCVTAAPIGQ